MTGFTLRKFSRPSATASLSLDFSPRLRLARKSRLRQSRFHATGLGVLGARNSELATCGGAPVCQADNLFHLVAQTSGRAALLSSPHFMIDLMDGAPSCIRSCNHGGQLSGS